MLSAKSVICLVLLQHFCAGKELPAFFKTCKRGDTNIDKCIQEKASLVLPELLNGVTDLNIPTLKNLKLPKIVTPSHFPYSLQFDGNVVSLEGVSYTVEAFDIAKQSNCATIYLPKVELKGDYKIQGFAGIPITGEGTAEVGLHNVTINVGWSFGANQVDGVNYLQVTMITMTSYKVDSICYQFDNLYDGDKDKGKTANKFLNENWLVLAGNFLPRVPYFIAEVAYKVTSKIVKHAPFDTLFPQ